MGEIYEGARGDIRNEGISDQDNDIFETHLEDKIHHVLHGFGIVLLVLLRPLLRNVIVVLFALKNRVCRTKQISN